MTNNLIREVAKIDHKAAIFMQRKIPLLRMRRLIISDGLLRDNLSSCFTFISTPQGHQYWRNISNQLPDLYK